MSVTIPKQLLDRVDSGHNDAGELVFVERALNYVERETYNIEFPPLEAEKYIPFDDSYPEGAKTVSYRQYTRTGIAKLITERGGDLPTVKMFVKEFVRAFYRIGASYEYTLDDLLAAQFAASTGSGINIDLEHATAARQAIQRGLDVVAAIGTTTSATIPGLGVGIGPDVGMLGLLNQPNATVYTVAPGGSGLTTWASKTPDEKIADLTGIYAAMVSSTYKLFTPDTILLPITQFENANGQRMGDGSDETVITFFKKIKPGLVIDSWQYCSGAGTGGTDRMVAFIRNRRYVRMVVSQRFRQQPPDWRNLTLWTLCTAKTAGVLAPYPLSISYGDGI